VPCKFVDWEGRSIRVVGDLQVLSSRTPATLLSFARRFPPPWTAEETDACFIVRDANGHALAYVYSEEEPGGARRPSCSPATRPGASPRTSPSCRSYWGWTSALNPSWPTFARSPTSRRLRPHRAHRCCHRHDLLRHPPCEGAPALHQEMKSTSCRPAASRRPGPSRRPTPASSSATPNGQALAYVYFEEESDRRSD
jgi:hypothetical protein